MFVKNFNKLILKDFNFYCKSRQFNKVLSRALSTSYTKFNSTQDFIVKSPLKSLVYPDCSIDQYVWADINKWSNKTAIVDGITNRSITYSELRDQCRALAVQLQTNLNLQPNDTIALCIPNSIEFPIVALGGCEAGMIITTINPVYTSDEISRQLIDSGAKILFGEASMSNILKDAVQKSKMAIKVIYTTSSPGEAIPADGIRFDDLIDPKGLDLTLLKEVNRDCNSVTFLPYSSGTTGLNKGVMLSHKNIISNSMAMRNKEVGVTNDSIGNHQDVVPCVLPFFHIYGLVVTLLSKLAQGCKIITLPKFHPDTFLNVLEKYQGNVLHLVPPIIIFFNSYDKIRQEHTKSVEYVLCGAAPLGPGDMEKFLKIAPKTQYIQAYGLTEASPVTHAMSKTSRNYASVGNPIYDTDSKIVEVGDQEFRGIGPNKTGEILVKGPQVMLGYLNNEKATKETLTADGWLRTGDIGHHDENGDFYITDRLKELIKVKGFQVAPAELEEILRMHPEITDAAVIGIPNPATGELPRAFVVTKKNSAVNEKSIQDFVAKKVSEFKRLAGGVEFVDSIPKNATGKILRRELKKRYI